MTAPTDPVALLKLAARRVREYGAAATPGPWQSRDGGMHMYGDFGWYVSGPAGTPEFDDSEAGKADADWVALMSPAIAEPLAKVLDDATEGMERGFEDGFDHSDVYDGELQLARLIVEAGAR